jgi:UDP-N-acetylmuramoylalanine--D-glutamate ligase
LAVLELSSFQLETTHAVNARTATILNISADHMDRYTSFGDYVLAKARILKGSKIAVLPSHDSGVSQITTSNKIVRFSLQEPQAECDFGLHRIQGRRWLLKGKKKIMQLRDVPLVGTHNVSNVLAAFALLDDFKLDTATMIDAVKSFEGLPHRMQTVAQNKGVIWVNDSKATNIGATASALKSLEQPIIWIAGGEGKGADFSELAELDTHQIKHLITLGRDGDQIANVFAQRLQISSVATLKEAVLLAAERAVSGDLVLLSPACASFDMFANYVDRGEQFVACVNALSSHDVAKRRKGTQ